MSAARRKKRDLTKEVDGEVWIAVGEVANRIGRIRQQVLRWCAFWDSTTDDVRQQFRHPLPECRRDLDGHETRYFRESDLDSIRKFRDQVSAYGFFSRLDDATWKGITNQKRSE